MLLTDAPQPSPRGWNLGEEVPPGYVLTLLGGLLYPNRMGYVGFQASSIASDEAARRPADSVISAQLGSSWAQPA